MKAIERFLEAIPGPKNNGAEWQTIHEFITDVVADYDPGMSEQEQLELLAACLIELGDSVRVISRTLALHRLELTTKKKNLVKCPYCGGCGVGEYWYHALNETTSAECHVCDGAGKIAKKDLDLALSALPDGG